MFVPSMRTKRSVEADIPPGQKGSVGVNFNEGPCQVALKI